MNFLLSDILKKLDLFGQPVLLKFNGNEKSKSLIGGWFSLSLLAFVVWAVYIVGQDIIFRNNPKLIMSETFTENPEPLTLSDLTFNFAAGLQVPITYAHYINESIYNLEAHFVTQTREFDQNGTLQIKTEYISLAVERCNKEHFGIHSSKFENLELSEMYCLKRDQSSLDKLVLQGTFESPIFQDIEIIIKPCDPETPNVECAPKQIIDQMLGSCYFAIYYTNLAIDAKNATNPSFVFRDSYYTAVSNSFFKDIPLWLSHIQMKSDFGWLIAKEKIENFVRVGYVGESAAFLQKNQKRMMNLRIRMDKIKTYYERSYLKIGDILASVNGFATFGLIIVFLFIGPYSKIKFYEKLINELFDLKMLQNDIGKTLKSVPTQKVTINKHIAGKNEENIPKIKTDEVKLRVNSKYDKSMEFSLRNDLEAMRLASSDGEKDIKTSPKGLVHHLSFPCKIDQNNRSTQPLVGCNEMKSVGFIMDRLQEPQRTRKTAAFQNPDLQKSQQKYILNPTINDVSPPSPKPNGPEFLWKKPELYHAEPKARILQNYDQSSPVETFAVLESLILENNELHRSPSKKLFRPTSIFKKMNVRKSNPSFELKEEEHGERAKQVFEPADEEIDEKDMEKNAEILSCHLNKDSDKLNISFKDYIFSYFWRSSVLKAKLNLLDEGIRRIEERIDIFNVLKKFREIDKMKLLLLENEQLVLFDTLPKPELLSAKMSNRSQRSSVWFGRFKDTKFVSEQRKKDLVLLSYKNLKKKSDKTMIDQKLLDVYDDLISNC